MPNEKSPLNSSGGRFRVPRGGGRQPGGFGLGPAGFCVCPNCGQKGPHKRGVPCYRTKCLECGNMMVRER